MKNLLTTFLGGQPLYYKDFEFAQEQIRELAKSSFGYLPNDIVNILNGAEFTLSTDGYTIDVTTDGWAWYNGEYYYIPIQSATGSTPNVLKWYIEETYDTRGLKTFEDATVGQKDVYQVKVLKLNYVSGVIDAPLFSESEIVNKKTNWEKITVNAPWSDFLFTDFEEGLYARINKEGHLELKGTLTTSSAPTGTVITVLSEKYRPLFIRDVVCVYFSAPAVIRVKPNGEVVFVTPTTTSSLMLLNNEIILK